ncbi:MAG: acyl-CoA/acyl-ACP dehydrogenase, partial [Candidatus Tectomicrobia bacterium]|nr:acyl-CoA/acyl-ACP dehydrogenase [Candidatus Tectomicrobia bacterium]
LTQEQQDWKSRVADLADREVAPHAERVDKDRRYPTESLQALKREGLWGLRVSKEHGGLGADLVTTCLIVEEIAKRCPSTAMCYKMHLEAAEVICRIPSQHQVQHVIEPMARGEVFATVAGSESWGNGDNWTSSRSFSAVRPVDGGYQLDGIRKSYVTSAGEATHHFFICRIGEDAEPGQLSLLFVERDEIDWEILEPWEGLGLRGNGSSPVRFSGFVPEAHRIGQAHTAMRDVSQLFPPVMGLTYAAAYLGVGSGAYEIACQEGNRRFASGSRRLDAPINQRRMAELATRIEAAQTMLHAVASAFDAGTLSSMAPVMQAKVFCSETAAHATQELMTMFGGTAFASRLPFERYFRDARAGLIMALANDAAYQDIASMLFRETT